MKVKNILETEAYELNEKEKTPVIKNWLGREGLQLIKSFTNEEKENAKGIFYVLSHKFKLHHNRIVLSLQYLKPKRNSHKSAQEWIGRLQTRAADCDYNKYDRRLT